MKKLFMLYSVTFWFLILSAVVNNVSAQKFQNPIIPGFHPDPSVCRVGDDYYLVNSSFEWYPGIPIFHSKDLVNWEQIGYVLTRPSQLNMDEKVRASEGIWAPTIRYSNGTFYVIVTCQSCGGNLFVTAKDPRGPWSDSFFIQDSPGIDPELFFDTDGKVYYVGCSQGRWGPPRRWEWEDRIYLQEFDLATKKLVGEKYHLTSGYASNARWCEGPHIYKINGKYLLMTAEGGTWEEHSVVVFYSDSLKKPFTPYHVNPVLTHRHLGNDIDITTTGHADLFQTQNGDWWSVVLAVRPINGGFRLLGRETFLTPVKFQGDVPIFNPGVGRLLMEEKRPNLAWHPFPKKAARDEFNSDSLGLDWNFLRTPKSKWHCLTNKKGSLEINLRPEKITEVCNPSLIARRIEQFQFEAYSKMSFTPQGENEEAGLTVLQNERFNYRITMRTEGGKQYIELIKCGTDDSQKRNALVQETVAKEEYKGSNVVLGIKADGLDYSFYFGNKKESLKKLGTTQDGRILSSNWAGGFIGAFIGMYASSNGKVSSNKASFDWFEYSAK